MRLQICWIIVNHHINIFNFSYESVDISKNANLKWMNYTPPFNDAFYSIQNAANQIKQYTNNRTNMSH